MNYRLHPDAALEHEEQIAYYEERRAGLGRRYHLAMLRNTHRKFVMRPSDRLVDPSYSQGRDVKLQHDWRSLLIAGVN